jgi:ATP-dependent exoDNAse (exonuclease V) alpha subunit
MNKLLKKLNNPKGIYINAFYDENDLVIRKENDYSDEDRILVNGDYGYLQRINGKPVVKYITGEEETVNDKTLKNSFQHFWCSTIHKMQGSQEELIILLMDPSHSMWNYNEDKKNLLYTAISRCKSKCIIIGKWKTFENVQINNQESNFYSLFMKEFQDPETGDIYEHE